ncbi:MAG: thioredoxin family protein [Acidobacteriota bacterium]|nr:thioredoxin family protein [Acidobacteriota bacterium]
MNQQIIWENDFERAQTRAAAEDKLILIDFFDPTRGGCQTLERVTYPESAVAGTINNSYVALQINTKEADAKPIVECYRQVWTPDLRMLDADGFEYYR